MDFNLTDLFKIHHNINVGDLSIPFPSDSEIYSRIIREKFPDMPAIETEQLEPEDISYYGTPIWFPIVFEGGNYLRYNKGALEEKEMADFRLPLSFVAEFSKGKFIEKTPTGGNNGSVVELFGHDNWQVTLSGFILPDPGQPDGLTGLEDQWTALKEFDELADAISVRGDIFSRHDIQRIVIENISDKQVVGQPGIIPVTLQCSSHSAVDLII